MSNNFDTPVLLDAGISTPAVPGDYFGFGRAAGGTVSTGPRIYAGAGNPSGTLVAPIGSLWLRNDGGDPLFNNDGTALGWHGLSFTDYAIEDDGAATITALDLQTQPVTGDTFGIGANTYQFRIAGQNVTNDAFIAIAIAPGGVGDTQTNVVAAINATYSPNAHPTIFRTDGVTPALANGTVNIWAFDGGTRIFVVSATAPGGTVTGALTNAVLAENITPAADVWACGNVNTNTLGGASAGTRQMATVSVTITAEMIAYGRTYFCVPFSAVERSVCILSALGVQRANGADTFNPMVVAPGVGTFVELVLAGGAAPNIQATDIVQITFWSAAT